MPPPTETLRVAISRAAPSAIPSPPPGSNGDIVGAVRPQVIVASNVQKQTGLVTSAIARDYAVDTTRLWHPPEIRRSGEGVKYKSPQLCRTIPKGARSQL